MENLKPCPFCGGYAQLEIENVEGYKGWHSYLVSCMSCGTHRLGGRYYDCGEPELEKTAKNKAIAAWNRRANDEADC